MISTQELEEATNSELKSWSFTLGYQLKPLFKGKMGQLTSLYKQAKDNIGVRTVIFGLDKYKKLPSKERFVYLFVSYMIGSLEIEERKIRTIRYRNVGLASRFCPHIDFDQLWKDNITKTRLCAPNYTSTSISIARRFWDTEDPVDLLVLADSLEESGRDFEADHFRSGSHSPACPIFQYILKGPNVP